MYKSAILVIFQFTFVYSRCLLATSGTYVGLKGGVNHCVLDFGEPFGNLSGKGLHGGICLGFDMRPCFAINITPQIKSSSYICEMWPGTSYYYTNLFIPATVTFRPFTTLCNTPYLGIGIAGNFQVYGKTVDMEWGTEQPIESLRNDFYFITCLGIENTLAGLKFLPEFSFNYNLTPNHPVATDISVSIYDFNLTIGLCYAF